MYRFVCLVLCFLAASCNRVALDDRRETVKESAAKADEIVKATSREVNVKETRPRLETSRGTPPETSPESSPPPPPPPPPPPVVDGKKHEFKVKEARPRLGPSLEQAQAYFAKHPFMPSKNDPYSLAFYYLCVGQKPEGLAAARSAATLLLDWTVPPAQLKAVASDTYRTTDWIPYVLDWCWDQIPNDTGQRDAFIARYQGYVSHFQSGWGATEGFEYGNYYWGYRRNEVLFSIATYHENTDAPKVLGTFFDKLWPAFVARAAGNMKGGIWPEGDQYGPYLAEYSAQILAACINCGRDLTQETSWFADGVEAFLIRSTPHKIRPRGMGKSIWSNFPSGDDSDNYTVPGYPDALKSTVHKPGSYLGDFMTVVAAQGNGNARWWLQQTQAPVSLHWQAWDPGGKAVAPDKKSLFASGMGWLFSRDDQASWMVQGNHAGSSHEHLDIGNVQLLYGDEFVLKETSGYAFRFPDGSAIRQTKYHNCPTFAGTFKTKNKGEVTYAGWQANAYVKGPAVVLDEVRSADFDYLALDLTKAYRATSTQVEGSGPLTGVPRDDCPFAGQTIREVLILRHGFGCALVIDRLTADAAYPKAVKIQNWHTVYKPTQDDVGVLGRVGDQAVRIMPVVGAPDVKLVDESDGVTNRSIDKQWRVELSVANAPSEVLATLIQGRGASAADVKVTSSEKDRTWNITIAYAKGSYEVAIEKGAGWKARPTVTFHAR